MTAAQSKVYIEILRHIKAYISEKQLSYGDKIPSEREFAEKLKVGRSSVREALRALELLGMIETRRGEGTFLKDFREHNLIEILGTFILEDSKAIDDIFEMNTILEQSALNLILNTSHEEALKQLARKLEENSMITRYEFMNNIVLIANNHLLSRIWRVLNEYVHFVAKGNKVDTYPKEYFENLVNALLIKNPEKTMKAYQMLALEENVE
ncbi:FadR/GntR family transcriptional regulator [Metabacillus litoralis]|uniref:FadR/GntR family transcriptional regulator n=1 Tax=Metabacillus litoralis TaxID=152268 RepID=UPI0013150E5B|nr:GntR family transcriptional regulator [Metabacillus litoralis]